MPTTGRGDPPAPQRPLFLLFWSVGILLGLFAREVVDGAGDAVRSSNVPAAAAATTGRDRTEPAPTMVVHLNAVLRLPTATPTGTPTPRPTATPDLTPIVDFCDPDTANAGEVCRMPFSTPTPVPTLPACFSTAANDGDLCQHRPTSTPDPNHRPVSPGTNAGTDINSLAARP